MSSRAKWVTAAVAAALWVAWIAAYAAWNMHPGIGVGHMVATQVMQMAAGMTTIVLILGCLVSPVIATAEVWRRIGIAEQQKQCDSCPRQAKRSAQYGNIIPVSFTGSIRPSADRPGRVGPGRARRRPAT